MSDHPQEESRGKSVGLMQGPRPKRLLTGRAKRWVVSLGLIAFLLPHAYVVTAGRELYPLSCAGMFAYQVTPQTPRYVFNLTADYADDTPTSEMSFKDGRANPRHFFNYFYGSVSHNSTHHFSDDDSPEQFAKRLKDWFVGYHNTWLKLNPDEPVPTTITLWLRQINPEQATPVAIMRFDTAAREVELHPQLQWPAQALEAGDDEEQGGGPGHD